MAENQDPNANAIQTLQQIVTAIAALNKTVNAVFPQSLSTSLTATSGAIVPLNYKGYLVVNNPLTNTDIKIGYYLP